jgi:hypothetical protein
MAASSMRVAVAARRVAQAGSWQPPAMGVRLALGRRNAPRPVDGPSVDQGTVAAGIRAVGRRRLRHRAEVAPHRGES